MEWKWNMKHAWILPYKAALAMFYLRLQKTRARNFAKGQPVSIASLFQPAKGTNKRLWFANYLRNCSKSIVTCHMLKEKVPTPKVMPTFGPHRSILPVGRVRYVRAYAKRAFTNGDNGDRIWDSVSTSSSPLDYLPSIDVSVDWGSSICEYDRKIFSFSSAAGKAFTLFVLEWFNTNIIFS